LPAAGLEASFAGTASYDVSIPAQVFKHTHYKYLTNAKPPCSPPTTELTSDFNVLVEDVSEPKKKSGDDGQTISVTGSIQLPKPKDDKKDDKK